MVGKGPNLDVCSGEDSCAHAGARRGSVSGPPAAPGTWTWVAAADEVPPNEMKVFAVAGVIVLVAHTDGAFLAVQALCPHELVPLIGGELAGETLTCLEHLWQFDLRTGAPLGEAIEGLRTYPVKNEGGQLYLAV
jgi:toluene monooxygenase system ferredoxin subunit